MKFVTTQFGKVDIPQDEIISFPEGLIGFPDSKRFALLGIDGESPFLWLQSLDDKDLAFAVTDPWIFNHEYDFLLSTTAKKNLQIVNTEDEKKVRVLVIATIPPDLTLASLNLKGPIIINLDQKLAMQLIIQEDYSPRYRIINKVTTSA